LPARPPLRPGRANSFIHFSRANFALAKQHISGRSSQKAVDIRRDSSEARPLQIALWIAPPRPFFRVRRAGVGMVSAHAANRYSARCRSPDLDGRQAHPIERRDNMLVGAASSHTARTCSACSDVLRFAHHEAGGAGYLTCSPSCPRS
jgi:hypothetical protein